MKIKKFKTNNYNNLLIKLKLAELRVQNFYLNSQNFINLIAKLKRAFKIIYKYHVNKKKIMFVGVSEKINSNFKKLLKKSRHIFLSDTFWNYGILTNPSVALFNLKRNHKILKKINFKLKNLKKINLVVVLESAYQKIIANECYKTRLPIIFLNNTNANPRLYENYSLPIDCAFSKKKVGNSLFYSMLFALLKKREIFLSNIRKNNFVYKNKVKRFYTKQSLNFLKNKGNGNYTFKKKKT